MAWAAWGSLGLAAEQVAHVGTAARDADQPRSLVDQIIDGRGAASLFLEQVEQHAGIEVAGARAHHQPAGRREAHRGVDALAALGRPPCWRRCPDGRRSRGRRPPRRRPPSRSFCHDVLVRKPVKTVAQHALVPKASGQRKTLGHLGHLAVKRRVEAGDLLQARIVLAARPEWLSVRGADARGPGERSRSSVAKSSGVISCGWLYFAPAMHDAMAHGVRPAGRESAVRSQSEQRFQMPRRGRADRGSSSTNVLPAASRI